MGYCKLSDLCGFMVNLIVYSSNRIVDFAEIICIYFILLMVKSSFVYDFMSSNFIMTDVPIERFYLF